MTATSDALERINSSQGDSTLELIGLGLTSDDLEELREPLLAFAGLTELDLSSNQLDTLPEWLGGLTDLTTLDLWNNQLSTLPDTLGNLANLTMLRVSDNRLKKLPETLGNLTELAELDLGDNQLSTLPDTLGTLTKLTTLILSRNELEVLPEQVCTLTDLTYLNLNNNELSTLPEKFGNLTKLTELHLWANQLTTTPEQLGELAALTEIDLGKNQLSTLPDTLGNLTKLTVLDLWENRLTALPGNLVKLTKLTKLVLWDNNFTTLPEWLGNITSLTEIDLGSNQLSALPETLSNLASLTKLDLSSNQLETLPEGLCDLAELTSLQLAGNRLTRLPDALGNLTSLTDLNVGDNQLVALPETIGELRDLRSIHLDENQLRSLPRSLGRLEKIQRIDVVPNPLPPEVIAAAEEGTEELLNYLRLVHDDGVEIAEAKLVFVGEGEAGKSTLLAALRGDPWVDGRPQTHGMEIKPVTVADHDGITYTLNGWDFGGQQLYRPTHQLFFTAPAVYLVVWKPRPGPEVGMVEHWLSTIQHRAGPGARVHVVATHGGPTERVARIDELRLKERFGDLIVDFHTVDSLPGTGEAGDGYGIRELRAAIARTASTLPHVRRWYPAGWLRARTALAARPEQSLTYATYESLMIEQGLTKGAAESLAKNAHALGNWIYYSEEPTLAELVILKPDWLSVAIARVLEDPEAAGSGGLITHRTFGRIWSTNPRYTHAQQQVFLRLMERSELSYRLPELSADEPRSLVAQLVPNIRPNLDQVWHNFRPGEPEAVEICQVVERTSKRLANPDGLIYRLIVRLHRPDAGAAQQTYWQKGLIAHSRYGARALVTLTEDGVRVDVRGPDPKTFLRQVIDEIRNCVEGFWPGLKTRALVPCIGPCAAPGQGMFDVDKLIRAQDLGRVDYSCSFVDCDDYPAITSLLSGVAPRPSAIEGLAEEIALIGEQLDLVLAQQRVGTVRILRRLDAATDDVKISLGRHEILLDQLLRSFEDDAKDGPRLFSLTPIDGTPLHPGWTTRRMRLTLYCEHSLWPVHALDPDRPNAGVYTVKIPREWWVKAAPILKITSTLIKPFLGVGLAAAELGTSDAEWDAMGKQLKLAKETLNAAAVATESLTGTKETKLAAEGDAIRAQGGVLRALHAMLKEQDVTMADLRQVRDHQGRFIWVHPRFVSIYQLPLPPIPS